MFIDADSFDCSTHQIIKFSGGELQVKLKQSTISTLDKEDDIIIFSRMSSSDRLMQVLLLKDAIERLPTCYAYTGKISLMIPYLPYARQDRVCENGEAFSLKVFANIINSARFDNVYVNDAHSDVGPALLDRCYNMSPDPMIRTSICNIHKIYDYTHKPINIISPDAGANKKINKIYASLKNQLFYPRTSVKDEVVGDLIKCDKSRDTKTGALSGFEVFADDLKNRPCLIIDDICDGGGTFIGLADELKKKNAGDLYLYVTHGIFSKDIYELLVKFVNIYTTNTFQVQQNHPRLIVVDPGLQEYKV